jgi:hypothetical protein
MIGLAILRHHGISRARMTPSIRRGRRTGKPYFPMDPDATQESLLLQTMPICNFGETPTCYLWLTRASFPLTPAQHHPCSTVAGPTADWQGDSGQRMRHGQQNHSWTSSWPGIFLHAPQHGVSGITTVAMRPLRRSHAAPGVPDVEVASRAVNRPKPRVVSRTGTSSSLVCTTDAV